MRIFLDMDEILTDFVGGAARKWGTTRQAVEDHWRPGEWDMVPPLSAAIGRNPPLTAEAFWARLNGSEDFWTGLNPLPFAESVLALTREFAPGDWYVVSAPSRCDSSYSGKVKWLKRYFGESFDRFLLTPHKHLFARPEAILIDDRDSNVEAFRKAGGRGIVFPRLHNSMSGMRNHPVEFVASQLRLLKESFACT